MTTDTARQPPSMRVPGVRWALLVTVLVAAVGCVLAIVVGGRPELFGVLAGGALVGGFFLFGTLNTALAAAYAPRLAMVVALLTYTLQVVVLGLVLVALTRSGATDGEVDVAWLAGTVIAGTLGWTGALVADALRTDLEGDESRSVTVAGPTEVTPEGVVRG